LKIDEFLVLYRRYLETYNLDIREGMAYVQALYSALGDTIDHIRVV
jgi:hypothetical protein